MNRIISLSAIILTFAILALSLRGNPGNVDLMTAANERYLQRGPLELSPERGRYALTYSLVENKSLVLPLQMARFSAPDVAYMNGDYYTLFAPGVSLLTIPGYIAGKAIGLSQVGTYAVIAIIALLNVILIKMIATHLRASVPASILAGIAFLFATPAYAYSVSLYQHHVSVFLLLSSSYLIIKSDKLISIITASLLAGLSVLVDYPNAFLMVPIISYAVIKLFKIYTARTRIILDFNITKSAAITMFAIPIAALFYYNYLSFGHPAKLSSGLPSVDVISEDGTPLVYKYKDGESELVSIANEEFVIGEIYTTFFDTRNLANGLYTHLLSPDRGILKYAPFTFFAIPGIFVLYKKRPSETVFLTTVMLFNIVLYSLWGDPWGGWAFGSRYLIPTYAISAIFIASFLSSRKAAYYWLIAFAVALYYSLYVNAAGALTTNKLPPKIQILELESVTGRIELYDYKRNLEELYDSGTKSYAYKTHLFKYVTPKQFYLLIVNVLFAYSLFALVASAKHNNKIDFDQQ